MKAIILAGIAGLSLTACAGTQLPGTAEPLTATQSACVQSYAIAVIKDTEGFNAMATKDKAIFITGKVLEGADACAIVLTPNAQAALTAAVTLLTD